MGGLGLVLDLVVRTGRRDGKRSAQRAALTTSPDTARHETPLFNLFPSGSAAGKGIGLKVGRIGAGDVGGLIVLLHRFVALIHSEQLSLLGPSLRFYVCGWAAALWSDSTGSTSTSQPLLVGIPVPSVLPPIN